MRQLADTGALVGGEDGELDVLGGHEVEDIAVDGGLGEPHAFGLAVEAVLSDIASDAPNARVVVLDYPQFYDLSHSSGCIGLSTTDRTDLDQAAVDLDNALQAAAARHGDVFADVQQAFAGHQICDSSSWLHSLNFLDIDESYHPTAAGQAGAYYPAFSAAAG